MFIKSISKKDYDEVLKTDNYYEGRWEYFKEVVDLIKKENPITVLELGAYTLPMTNGDTIGWDKEKMGIVKTTYNFDATKIPWPIQKKYDIFIALQVWEHLNNKQKEAFQEVMRVSKKAILSFPYLWGNEIKWMSKDNVHYMIDKNKIAKWTSNTNPVWTKIVARRLIYFFDFEKDIKIVDFDDFSEDNNRLDLLFKLKEKIPNFKVNLFTVPGKCSENFCRKVNKLDWVQLFLHGQNHSYLECENWTGEYMEKYLDKYENWNCFQRGFKSPYWRGNSEIYKVLEKRGYILAENKPVDYNGKLYLLGKNSIHGHIQNTCGNGIQEIFDEILKYKNCCFEFIQTLQILKEIK